MAVAARGLEEDSDGAITGGQWIASMETGEDLKEAWTKVAPVVVRQQRTAFVMLMAQAKKPECGRELIDWNTPANHRAEGVSLNPP
ncbi:unnamed protein product [Arctogadus glacialis]